MSAGEIILKVLARETAPITKMQLDRNAPQVPHGPMVKALIELQSRSFVTFERGPGRSLLVQITDLGGRFLVYLEASKKTEGLKWTI